MSQLIIDVFFTTVFLLLLILLSKIRLKAFENNRDSYQYTFLGISVLGIVSIFQLGGHQNLFESVPFLADPVYLELILGIGIVSGVTLMLAGASIWLPGKSKKIERTNKSTTSSGILNIETIIFHSQNSKTILNCIPQMISNEFDFGAYVVFSKQNRLKKYVCTAYGGIGNNEINLLKDIAPKEHAKMYKRYGQ